MFRFGVLFAIVASLGGCGAAAAEDDEGVTAFNNHCRNCHSVNKGDNRLGPSLYGVFGARAGLVEGYRSYSGSLTGVTWDEATLDKFIANPAAVAASTTMIYPAVGDHAERKRIIAFLKSINGR